MRYDEMRKRNEDLQRLHNEFAEDDAEQMHLDYKALLQVPAFRRVFVAIIKRARVFGSISYDGCETNAVMKNIGFRELGVDIYMAANEADGEMVLQAIKERNEIERERKARCDAVLGNQ
jgi:hypothetical protein